MVAGPVPLPCAPTPAPGLAPCRRLSLSRAHPALREAASQQGWFERETVAVELGGTLTEEKLASLAAWARRHRGLCAARCRFPSP